MAGPGFKSLTSKLLTAEWVNVTKLEIRELEVTDEAAFVRAKHAWDSAAGFVFLTRYEEGMSFENYVRLLKDHRMGVNLPPNFVPDTCHFAFLDGEIVGRVSIRHVLNDFLRQVGGHIGYGVVPLHRGKGIATALLRHALREAKAIGIDRALLTCDEGNVASSRVIEKCGGIFENSVPAGDGSSGKKKRYWVVCEG